MMMMMMMMLWRAALLLLLLLLATLQKRPRLRLFACCDEHVRKAVALYPANLVSLVSLASTVLPFLDAFCSQRIVMTDTFRDQRVK
jgi:hypothetical protein